MRIVLAANPEVDQPWVTDAAADLVRQTGATVAVVAVDELEIEHLAPLPRSVYIERAERAKNEAVRRLAEAGIDATGTVLPGRPVDQIIRFGEEQAADLIIVGSSARPLVAQRLLGSVPLSLIQRAGRPVLVVTHPATES
ncbi:nucleotide-binding universal stress UspA family protein [Actinoplanes lutulentus]|uniref:Nucleotide-binding universal stress UspA family protein n=1 Tax=Actinoplanes lutulentus TaxID=1287878 RepID=A0A327ZFS4_9ACTN|nr:universal stress protein [Actinoplanes lutulentus]MBB2946843.1 nucleotide-binding universal stress UspA family protein [Actinoplanes lutulentus]RAK35737.1 nucleotide-binding universal stress UspA family protein [Actinoplanes lutulentus]